jgi:glyoxylase-like metal-dependent hydrolase (beta-lactamase superfamily II)
MPTLFALLLMAQAPLPRDSTARVERLADGVYAIIHDDATDQWPHGNTGVVVSDDGVLVVDATYLPSRARGDIALIRRITDRPVRYLVNTHWHMDHTHGNEAYRDAFPGVTIVTERRTREFSELNTRYWSRYSTAPDSPRRQALRELEEEQARGADSTGKAHTAEDKRRLETVIRQRNGELEELAKVRVVVADQVFDGATTLWLGGRRVELVDHGRANSPHDVTIYLPKERILFTGDILVQSPVPYTGMSWPVPWIDVLAELEKLPVTAGHARSYLHPADAGAASGGDLAGAATGGGGSADGVDPGFAAAGRRSAQGAGLGRQGARRGLGLHRAHRDRACLARRAGTGVSLSALQDRPQTILASLRRCAADPAP